MLYIVIVLSIMAIVIDLKNRNTYKNQMIISNAIHSHNMDTIEKGCSVSIIHYTCMRKYSYSFLNIFDWDYKNIVSPEIYERLEPFIDEENWNNE